MRKHYRVFEKGKGIGGEFIKIHEKLGRRQKAINKSDNHIKGTSEHTKRMDLMICLGKKPNPTQEVPYETIIRGFRSAWQQQFDGNH